MTILPAAIASIADPAAVAQRVATSLHRGVVHVEPRWVTGRALKELREAGEQLCSSRAAPAVFGGTQLDTTRRACSVVDLLGDAWAEMPPALGSLIGALDGLREQLQVATSRPLLDEAEMQLLSYPTGGRYCRHVDDGISTAHLPVRRSISTILYMTPQDWQAPVDGGALRIHEDGQGTDPYDVHPEGGSLILFDSATVSHEVLETHRERLVCVGWFLESRSTRAQNRH